MYNYSFVMVEQKISLIFCKKKIGMLLIDN